jgi:hypothetical protein
VGGEVIVSWLARGLITLGLLFLAALLILGGLIAWVDYGLSHHDRAPDAAVYARSVAVRSADRTTAAWFDGQFARLGREAPWLRSAGQSVHDSCRAASDSSGPWMLICTRMQTGYYAYAGGGRIGALEHALAEIGWRGFTVTSQALGADYNIEAGPPKAGLRVTWIGPATPPAVSQLLTSYAAAFGRDLRAGENGVLQASPPTPGRIMRALAAPDKNLFMVMLAVTYATSAPSS